MCPIDVLTAREREILAELASGGSNKRIAQTLDIGERTVKHQMTNNLHKLRVRNRVEAALVVQRWLSS
ncbi:MAG: two-component system nitrate/nitrite response regulator NarL [Gammaproteobacteria bacterium]|jgi:two-component system nitrate/nitrite response regulator NarL